MDEKLSISIVHHHGLDMLQHCLQSIYNHAPTFPFEVIVVDNVSTDGAVEMMEKDFPQIRILKNTERHGFGHNQNIGIQASAGEFIFIYNDDTLLHGQALTTLCDFLDRNPDVGLVGPRLVNEDNTLQLSCYKFPSPLRYVWENLLLTAAFPNSPVFGDYRKWPHNEVRDVEFVIGAAMLVRKSVIEQVGSFDERFFMYSEETDWQMRIRKAGWKIMLCPDATVTHFGGQSSEGAKDKQFCEFNRSSVKLIKKHYGTLGVFVQRCAMIEGALLRLLAWSLIGMCSSSKKAASQKNLRTWTRLLKWWCGLGPHEGYSDPGSIGVLTIGIVASLMLQFLTSQSSSLAAEIPKQNIINVCDNGAVKDGRTYATDAIQKSIEQCANLGGGRVYVPPGDYLISTIILKDNVELFIEAGATLRGSTNIADYSKHHLIYAIGAKNIAISGRGCINGSGPAFWQKLEKVSEESERLRSVGGWVPAFDYYPRPRPDFLIRFTNCTNVQVSNICINDSPGWTVHLLACDDVKIKGITIKNPNYGSNTDGIDIDACHDVIVSDCNISTGDDAIVLKNTNYDGLKRTQSNIIVTNCIIDTTCNAFKIGTETTADFEDIVFANSIIHAQGPYGPITGISIETVDGASLRRVSVNNIVMHGARAPIFMRLGNRGRGQKTPTPGTLSDIRINNIFADGVTHPSLLSGIPDNRIKDVYIENVHVSMSVDAADQIADRKVPEYPDHYPESVMFNRLPAYGFYCRHVDGLKLHNVSVDCLQRDKRKLLLLDDVKNFEQVLLKGRVRRRPECG